MNHTPQHFFIGILLVLLPVARTAAQDLVYFTPESSNLIVFHSARDHWIFHAATSRVSGEMPLVSDNPTLRVEIDLRYLTMEETHPGPYIAEWLFETLNHPRAVLTISRWQGWPAGGIAPGETLEITGVGALTFHGVTNPVELPVSLSFQTQRRGAIDEPVLVLSTAYTLDATAFDITPPELFQPLLSAIEVRIHLTGRPTPYGDQAATYNLLWRAAYDTASAYGYPEVLPVHALYACLGSPDDALKRHLAHLDVNVDAVRSLIESRLRAEQPDPGARRTLTGAIFWRLHQQAHREAYQIDQEIVTPVHMLLASLVKVDTGVTDALAQHGLTYDRLLALFNERPKPAREVRFLGNPFFTSRPDSIPLRYARNVWDIQHWDGRLYLGHGNSSNGGPAVNAGPIPIISYDLHAGRFATEFTVDEEQIDRYRILGVHLTVPGHDPRDPWNLGNFYRLDRGDWTKIRTIPLGIHAYDILAYRDTIFVAEGTTGGAMVARSADGGQTWERYRLTEGRRAFELFIVDDTLYVSAYQGILYRYTGQGFTRVRVELFPDARHGRNPLVVRSVPFKQHLLYIGADNTNDHQWLPFAAYRTSRIDEAQRLDLPLADVPYDILIRGDTAYILTNRMNSPASDVKIIIYQSRDLIEWREAVRFDAPSFARSFEYVDGRFYVGLGTVTSPLNEASGNLYRVTP